MVALHHIDLQIQSTASDGKHTPSEIVRMARERGLSVVSLTDHDTVAGVAEAVASANGTNIRVISGIEMSAEERGIHVLGYGIDHEDSALLEVLGRVQEGRVVGARKMVENLRSEGFALDWDDVEREAGNAAVTRPHLARAVLGRKENKERLSGVRTAYEFIDAFLSNESSNYVRRAHLNAGDVIALLHQCGGVAVWSHPVVPEFRKNQYDALEEFLRQLIEWGIDGVEVFNPSHAEDDVEFLEGLAKKYHLLRTAGSDFHEMQETPPVETGLHSARFLGDYETYGFSTDGIIEALDTAIVKRRQA